MPVHLGCFFSSNSNRSMNNVISETNELKTKNKYHNDADSLYFEKKHWRLLDKYGFVGIILCQGRNDLKMVVFYLWLVFCT